MSLTATQRIALATALGCVVLFSLAGLAWRFQSRGSAEGTQFLSPPDQASQVRVSVLGAVVHQGTYVVPEGTLVGDVLKLAGGPRQDGDITQIDVAARVYSDTAIYIPFRPAPPPYQPPAGVDRSRVGLAEVSRPQVDSSEGDSGRHQPLGPPPPSGPPQPVNVNVATAKELEVLPGIGPKLAQRIVQYRAQYGPFAGPEDLTKVDGIGPAKMERIKPFVSF
ncbi:MAG: helix-hairpin-helix domain-containing protein [Armatimonadetes bacterium]|nr:helix-hairpin-helix domain-containing protein [Armatimonadota bacterium]